MANELAYLNMLPTLYLWYAGCSHMLLHRQHDLARKRHERRFLLGRSLVMRDVDALKFHRALTRKHAT
jgi:hypothetical protein